MKCTARAGVSLVSECDVIVVMFEKAAGDTHQNVANKWQMSMSMDTNILHNISCWLMNHPAEENERTNERTFECDREQTGNINMTRLPFVTLSFSASFSTDIAIALAPLLRSDRFARSTPRTLHTIMKTICPEHTFRWKYDSPCIIIISTSFCVYYSRVVCTRASTEMKRDEGKTAFHALVTFQQQQKKQ